MPHPKCERRTPKKPIAARCFGLLIVWLLAVPGIARAQDPTGAALTEAEALRRGLARPGLSDLLEGEIGVPEGDQIKAGLWPNPTVLYSREQTYGGTAASGEDYAWLTQSFDLSGRRGLRTDAAGHRVQAARHQASSKRLAVRAEILVRFYQVLYLQKRAAGLESWEREMAAVGEAVARREAAGDVSGYDRRRLDRERASARARLQVEQASLARARERLGGILGSGSATQTNELQVAGDLLPATPPSSQQTAVANVSLRPELRALEESASAADLERRAAGRWWLPELTLGGGLKRVDSGRGRASGFLVIASVALPIFDRNQDEEVRATARARSARGRHQLELAETAAEARGLSAQVTQLSAAARTSRVEAVQSSAELVRTAEAAYRGGELGILELLDAYRSALDAQLRALDLEWEARRARIELDRVTEGASP